MQAIGKNIIVEMNKIGVSETKGGLLLAEKQREDIRYAEGKILSKGEEIVGLKIDDIIYFDKNNSHQIEIKKEIYNVVHLNNVVVVL